MLEALGVRFAFGVSGGAIAAVWGALSASSLKVVHCRHESGAVFAATEAHFATGEPVAVFATTGPGITNALTGILAAKGEGAKIILISGHSTAANRGRWAIQETDSDFLPSGVTSPGALFDMATVLESADALPQIARRLANGLARPGGFICHLSVPTGLQSAGLTRPMPQLTRTSFIGAPDPGTVADCAQLLTQGSAALWIGFGARAAANEIRQIAECLQASVLCSPRAKGTFPENHPLFVGVTGMGGHESVAAFVKQSPPDRILVLGTRLGEPTSFWNPGLVPPKGFIHVDIDPAVPGVAYPDAPTFPVCADITQFLRALLEHLPLSSAPPRFSEKPDSIDLRPHSPIRPEALMRAIQDVAINRHDCVLMAESGNSFTWATHYLRFTNSERYRVSTGVGSMGHFACGVAGAAIATGKPTLAIVGDGAMLMNNEISTAVAHGAPAIWVVLNDARYNMCEQGMSILGLRADASIPPVDFSLFARSLGAAAEVLNCESEMSAAVERAILSGRPYVLDVRIDASSPAPSMARNRGLRAQGVGAPSAATHDDIAFPKTR